MPHLGCCLLACLRWLTAAHTVVVAVGLAHFFYMGCLALLYASHACCALGEVQLAGKSVECGEAHAGGIHYNGVLYFREPTAHPVLLLWGEHPRKDVLCALCSCLGGEWPLNHLHGERLWEWINAFHCVGCSLYSSLYSRGASMLFVLSYYIFFSLVSL